MNLNAYGAEIGSSWYRVIDFPHEKFQKKGPDALDKMIAYRFDTRLTQGLFPYRGIWNDKKEWSTSNTKVGVYVIDQGKDVWTYRLRRPATKEEAKAYALSNAKVAAVAVLNNEYSADKFTNVIQSVGLNGKAFKPPVRVDDDALNAIVKTAIRLKNAPFGPYGKMLETYTSSTNPAEGPNRRNNSKRGLYKNNTLSMNKAQMYTDIWDIDMAIVIKDADGALYKMFDDGSQILYYPFGKEFDLDPSKFIDGSELISKAIEESAESIDSDDEEED